MRQIKVYITITIILSLLSISSKMNAQNSADENQSLDARQQRIVVISAFTAKGDLDQLRHALGNGLDAGLTINEIKEVLLQLYAYCGFPRSIRGLNTFMAVLEGRKARGIQDETGPEATPLPDDVNKYEKGKKVLQQLTGRSMDAPPRGYAAFCPGIDVFLKEHLFADIFGRGLLSYKDREITTISALVSMGDVEPMVHGHMGIALNIGVTESQLKQLLSLIESNVGKTEANSGREVLSRITTSEKE